MKKIKLKGRRGIGKNTIVDDDVYNLMLKHTWWVNEDGYVCTTIKMKGYKMHRMIMNCPKGVEVDHIDGNPLNNIKRNMRLCTQAENKRNKKLYKTNKSGYKGVYWKCLLEKWGCYVRFNGKAIHLGYFENKKDAALAYNNKALEVFGEFAKINKI